MILTLKMLVMMKKIFATFLLSLLGFYSAVWAEEGWLFNTPVQNNVNYSTQSTVSPNSTAYYADPNYSNTNSNIYYYNNNENSLSGRVNQTQQVLTTQPAQSVQQVQSADDSKDGSFAENHPILTGLGIGVLALGGLALGLLSSDSDDDCDKYRKGDRYCPDRCCPHKYHHSR